MAKKYGILVALLLVLALSAGVFAQQQTMAKKLKVGDPAPALHIEKWIKGKPFKMADLKGKKALVIEFWATWCPPCRRSIPHLTEIQKKYKDRGLVVMGISNEDPNEVSSFVEDMGERMEYHVAVDDQYKTTKAYMMAAGQNGIPTAFAIDKNGKIVWIGHPLDPAFQDVLDKIAPEKKEETADSTTK